MKVDTNYLTGNPVVVYLYYTIPWAIGLVCLSSVPIVDGYFLGNYVGSNALAVVNLSIPVISLLMALEIMIATGASIRCGRYMGAHDYKNASRIFTQAVITVFAIIAIIALLLILNLDSVVGILGAPEELRSQLHQYLTIILLFNLFLPSGFILSFFIGLDGDPMLASVGMMISAITNIVLTWLLVAIFDFGIIGAAISSGISAFTNFVILLSHFIKKDRILYWLFTKENYTEVFSTMKNGISDGISDSLGALVVLFINWLIVYHYGANGLAAMAVINFILSVNTDMSFSLGDSLQMLVSSNTGAKLTKRTQGFLNLAVSTSITFGIIILIITIFWNNQISLLFIDESEQGILDLIKSGIFYVLPVFLFSGITITLMAYFSALEKPLYSGGIAISRSFAFPLIFLTVVPLLLDGIGIFVALSLAEFFSMAIALILLKRSRNTQ